MNNWRLLLLAVVVVVLPIGSFTESNLFDGRECCERSADDRPYGYREERRSLDGNREHRHKINEERRLSSLEENSDRRNEARRSSMLTRSESSLARSERRFSSEHSRLSRDQERRNRVTGLRVTRGSREDQNRNQDESGNAMVQIERDTRESKNRNTLDARATRSFRLSDDRDARSFERESRNSMSHLPIRSSRSFEDDRVSSKRAIFKQNREDLIISNTRRDTRLTRSDSRIQLEDNRERAVFEERTQEDQDNRHSRFSNARVSEIRGERAQVRSNDFNDNENRNSRVVRVELRRHRDIEMRNGINAVRRDSERISGDRIRDSRDESARLVRDRMDIRNIKSIGRHESRRSTDTLRNIEERHTDTQQSRDSRYSETPSVERLEGRSLSMDRLSTPLEYRDSRLYESRQQRENNRLSRDRTISSLREGRDNNDRIQVSHRVEASRDVREFSEEQNQRDNSRLSWEFTASPLREDTEHSVKSGRTFRETSEEQRLQREVNQRDRTIPMLRANREFRDRTERSQASRRIVDPSQTETSSRKIETRRHQIIRDNQKSDLRRQVLERSMERTIHITRSTNVERRHDFRVTRSADASRTHEDTRTNEREERLQAHDQDRITQQRVTRDVVTPQRIDTRRPSRTESIRLERFVRNRAEVTENERRKVQRNDDRTSSVVLNRRSNERVFAERRQDNLDAAKDSRDVRSEMEKNRDEVRMNERFGSRRQRDTSSERIVANRRQENRDTTRYSRNAQDITRNRDEVRIERTERRQESQVKDLHDQRDLVEVRRVRNLDSRNIRGTRNLVEARSERVLAERRQENRDSRILRNELRNNERQEIRHKREANRVERESRDVTDRLNERTRESTARSETRNERATKDVERQVPSNRILKTTAGHRDFRSGMREAGFRNIDAATLEETLVTDKSVDSNWQMALYTLQGIYLCGLVVQILTEKANVTKKRNWWSSPRNLIKVE